MMIAAGNQGRTRWRAQRRRVEAGITQALRRELLHIRRGDAPSEDTELPKARVIEQDQQHIWRAFGRAQYRRKSGWIGVLIRPAHLSFEAKIRSRQRLSRRWRWNRGANRCTGLRSLRRSDTRSRQ